MDNPKVNYIKSVGNYLDNEPDGTRMIGDDNITYVKKGKLWFPENRGITSEELAGLYPVPDDSEKGE